MNDAGRGHGGQRILRQLYGGSSRRAGHRVRALALPQARRDHVAAFVDEWQTGDQGDPSAIAGLVAGAGAIVHIAIDWTALNAGAIPNFERNLLSSLRLLEAARVAQARQFIFVSTLDIYHEVLPGRPVDENHPACPGSIYSAFKASVEAHLKAYYFSHAMNTSAWRPAAMYGIKQDLKRSLWFELVGQVKRGDRIATDLAGSVVWVQDVAEALALAVGEPSVAGQFYNLADTHLTWQSVAKMAKALGGSAALVEQVSTTRRSCLRHTQGRGLFHPPRQHDRLAPRIEGVHVYLVELRRGVESLGAT